MCTNSKQYTIVFSFELPTTYVAEIKETYFEIYTKQVSCPFAFLFYTTLTNFRTKYLMMCNVYTDVGGIK